MNYINKWFKIGLFKSEDSARKSVPKFFEDSKYEAHFTIEKNQDCLWVNKDYYTLRNLVETTDLCAVCEYKLLKNAHVVEKK